MTGRDTVSAWFVFEAKPAKAFPGEFGMRSGRKNATLDDLRPNRDNFRAADEAR